MADFYIARDDRQMRRTLRTRAGAVRTLVIDLSMWAADYSTVTTVTWSTPYGSAAASGASLASNVATVTVTTTAAGTSLVRAASTDGTHTVVTDIMVIAEDQAVVACPSDYWPACC